MSDHQFKDTVFNMYQARMEIEQWRARHEKDFVRHHDQLSDFHHAFQRLNFFCFFLFLQRNDASKPAKLALVGWLQSFHSTLASKMSFYFFPIFQKQEKEVGGDIRTLAGRLEVNYHGACVTAFFSRSILLESNCLF
jgi:hypothetical protein